MKGIMHVLVIGLTFAAASATHAQFEINWYTIDGGGATFSSAATYSVGSTTGQPDAGTQSGGSFTLTGGFWPAAAGITVGVNIVSANPPSAAGNPYVPGVPFRDVLDTGAGSTLTAGIGGAGTQPQGGIQYAQISVTFSAPPSPAPATSNVSIACTGGNCPSVGGVSGSGVGPYLLTLSGPIPPTHCTTLTFAGTSPGQKLQYQSLPGDADLNGSVNTVDLLWLVQRVNDGTANQTANLARYNVNRSTEPGNRVNTVDFLRLVQLLNGINTTQAFNGATVAACP